MIKLLNTTFYADLSGLDMDSRSMKYEKEKKNFCANCITKLSMDFGLNFVLLLRLVRLMNLIIILSWLIDIEGRDLLVR